MLSYRMCCNTSPNLHSRLHLEKQNFLIQTFQKNFVPLRRLFTLFIMTLLANCDRDQRDKLSRCAFSSEDPVVQEDIWSVRERMSNGLGSGQPRKGSLPCKYRVWATKLPLTTQQYWTKDQNSIRNEDSAWGGACHNLLYKHCVTHTNEYRDRITNVFYSM